MLSTTVKSLAAALLAALITTGIAVAAIGGSGNGNSGDRGGQGSQQRQGGPQGGPGGPPPFMRNMTYAEVHTQKDGKEVVIRVDKGKVKSVSSEAITVTANNNSDVTVPVDEDTKVLSPGKGSDLELSSLKEGTQVTIDREQGQPANVVAVKPKHQRGPQGPPANEQAGTEQEAQAR